MNNNLSPDDIWGDDSVNEPENAEETEDETEINPLTVVHTEGEEPCGSLSCFACTPNPHLDDSAWLSVTSDIIQSQALALAPLADMNVEDAIETGTSLVLGLITQYPVFGYSDVYAYAWELARLLHHWAGGNVPEIEIASEEGIDSFGARDNYTAEAATWLDCMYLGDFAMAERVLYSISKTIIQEYPEHQEEYYDQETLETKHPDELAKDVARMGIVTFLSLILVSTSSEIWNNVTSQD